MKVFFSRSQTQLYALLRREKQKKKEVKSSEGLQNQTPTRNLRLTTMFGCINTCLPYITKQHSTTNSLYSFAFIYNNELTAKMNKGKSINWEHSFAIHTFKYVFHTSFSATTVFISESQPNPLVQLPTTMSCVIEWTPLKCQTRECVCGTAFKPDSGNLDLSASSIVFKNPGLKPLSALNKVPPITRSLSTSISASSSSSFHILFFFPRPRCFGEAIEVCCLILNK